MWGEPKSGGKHISLQHRFLFCILNFFFIGASLSEPHTRELGGEISVRMYVCMFACLYPSDFAHELEVKCSRGHVRITADSKSRSHRFDTGK